MPDLQPWLSLDARLLYRKAGQLKTFYELKFTGGEVSNEGSSSLAGKISSKRARCVKSL
jgi:hypothetical protein